MSNKIIKNSIIEELKKDERLWNEGETEFNQTLLFHLLEKYDETLIKLLLENDTIKSKFFVEIDKIYVFKITDFKFFMEENKINNSYTNYLNEIGLHDGNNLVKNYTDVVLNFPYKDSLLLGGQSSEDDTDSYYEFSEKVTKSEEKIGFKSQSYNKKQSKRNEVFFNEILAHDEIDRLIQEKALVNWTKYTVDGKKEPSEIRRDANGLIKENLIIRGNNLLVMHSLKSNFTGRIKSIYIDPPYNTGSDGFKYNDRFNHSTWLTFMKNRLEVASKLLSDDGVILVQCDHHELGYLNVLMDEIFKVENKVQVISCKTSAPAGFKTVNPGPIDVTEYILFYSKNKSKVKFKKAYTAVNYDTNYNRYIENIGESSEKWKVVSIIDKYYEKVGISNNKEAKEKWGDNWKLIRDIGIGEFALENAERIVSQRDPHKPTKTIKDLMNKSKQVDGVLEHKRATDSVYLYKGGSLAFYSNKLKVIDGKLSPTELLTDFWSDISWAGIAGEGGVTLKNGKKPERLLQRIIDMTTDKGDIVLDYHLGSGTTAAVAHKMERQYIGIEQMDYGDNDATVRLHNVINGDQTGISQSVGWTYGGEFVYFELAEWNEHAKKEINKCTDLNELKNLFNDLSDKYFLDYNVKITQFKNKIINEKEFISLSLEQQKIMFLTMLDLNQLYVQSTEIDDEKFCITQKDKELTKLFYEEV